MSRFTIFESITSDRQWDSSVYDVNYESFDSMFWIEVRRVKKSQFDAIWTMLECCMSEKVDHAEFSSTQQHFF